MISISELMAVECDEDCCRVCDSAPSGKGGMTLKEISNSGGLDKALLVVERLPRLAPLRDEMLEAIRRKTGVFDQWLWEGKKLSAFAAFAATRFASKSKKPSKSYLEHRSWQLETLIRLNEKGNHG